MIGSVYGNWSGARRALSSSADANRPMARSETAHRQSTRLKGRNSPTNRSGCSQAANGLALRLVPVGGCSCEAAWRLEVYTPPVSKEDTG